MTTGIILCTAQENPIVYEIARELDFDDLEMEITLAIPHKKISGLRIQIHSNEANMLERGFNSKIEFEDTTERFPDYPEAMGLLRRLYEKIPDLEFSETFLGPPNDFKPLSEYLAMYCSS